MDITSVSNLAIWGNHSATMYPDFFNARIGTRPVTDVIKHTEWLEKDFISTVQQRGAAIIKARGLSSAASRHNAAIDTVRSLVNPTPKGDWTSVAVCTDGSYGIEKGLMFSYPIRSTGKSWEIVQDNAAQRIQPREDRHHRERTEGRKALVNDLIPK